MLIVYQAFLQVLVGLYRFFLVIPVVGPLPIVCGLLSCAVVSLLS